MSLTPHQRDLILRGLRSVETIDSAAERIALLNAAADLLQGDEVSVNCRVTARIVQEAEDAQLRLFNTIRLDS